MIHSLSIDFYKRNRKLPNVQTFAVCAPWTPHTVFSATMTKDQLMQRIKSITIGFPLGLETYCKRAQPVQ